ncbi:MAG: hypothetical protein WCI39_08220 [Gallionellaceae bacterium]
MKNFLLLMLVASLGIIGDAFGEQNLKTAELKNASAQLRKIVATLSAQSGVASSVVSAVVEAATLAEDAAQVAAVAPQDNNDWTGDHLQIKGNLYGLKKSCDSKKTKAECDQEYFAPAYVRFDVSKENADGSLIITPRNNFKPFECSENNTGCANKACATPKNICVYPWEEHGIYGWLFSRGSPVHFHLWAGAPIQVTSQTSFQPVQPYETYVINKQDVEKIPYVKYGWTFGALLAPFKYQRGYKAFNSSTSAQMYVGYKRDSNGTSEGPFISAGLANADIATAAGATTSKQGFSYGLGWIFEIKKNSGFRVLTMMGQDVFGANSGYQYEGDIWYSVSLGYSLDPQPAK